MRLLTMLCTFVHLGLSYDLGKSIDRVKFRHFWSQKQYKKAHSEIICGPWLLIGIKFSQSIQRFNQESWFSWPKSWGPWSTRSTEVGPEGIPKDTSTLQSSNLGVWDNTCWRCSAVLLAERTLPTGDCRESFHLLHIFPSPQLSFIPWSPSHFTNALTNDRLELRFPLPNYPLSRDHLFFFFKCKRQLRTKIPSPQLSFSQARPFPTLFFQIKMTN